MRKGAVNLFCFFLPVRGFRCAVAKDAAAGGGVTSGGEKGSGWIFFYDEKTHACVRGLESGCCQSGYRQFV